MGHNSELIIFLMHLSLREKFSMLLLHKNLTRAIDLSKMAAHVISHFSSQETGTISLLLVPKLPWNPLNLSHDAT